ncbi:MAG: coproporphyrinogen III oxidase, partial [Pseudomonadota bacterium]
QDLTAAAGMADYEISNHAAAGAESRHNLIYWRYGDYAGIGPGAHGRITGADGGRRAIETLRAPGDWLSAVGQSGHAISVTDLVVEPDQATEYMMMALRLREGVDLDRHANLAGQMIAPKRISALAELGLVQQDGVNLKATAEGRMVLDRVLGELLV